MMTVITDDYLVNTHIEFTTMTVTHTEKGLKN